MKAQVRDYNGTPTIYLDDQPIFGGIHWGFDYNFAAKNQEIIRHYAAAGIHIYSLDGTGTDWCGLRPGKRDPYDFEILGKRLQSVIEADPQALFNLRNMIETRYLLDDWWNKLHPDETELLSDGTRIAQSFASPSWQADVNELFKGLIAFLRQACLYDRVIAYQICTGVCGEWIKNESSMGIACGDYSLPMVRYFRDWLKRHYDGSLEALQSAWNDPQVTYDTAEVPSESEQLNTIHLTFRDPRREQKTIDFYACYAELCADSLLDFCRTIKEATGGEKLTGAFFGYLMDLSWNDVFFGNPEGIPSAEVSTLQRSGHLGLQKVLRSPDIDFIVSPYGYAFRGLGGDGLPMQPVDSLRVHGKLYLFEEDTRMHNNFDPDGRNQAMEHNIAIYHRNFAQVLTHGLGITWLENNQFMEAPQLADEVYDWLRRYEEIGAWSLRLDRTPRSEVAVFLDDESFFYQTVKNNLSLPLVFQQRVTNLNRFGAPHDIYLLNDLLEGRLPEYKLYIFLNPYHLNDQRRQALKNIVRRDGKTSLWLYAPGYLNSDVREQPFSTELMTDLTGLRFGRGINPWGPFMHITNFTHPITRDLPQDWFWGTTAPLGPLFHLDDPEATTLGQVVYSLGRCKPGFGIRTFNAGNPAAAWTSVYVATPNVPAPVLRGIARQAGVHLYNEEGDVLYATSSLLSAHTVAGGKRTFKLPGKVEVVYDLFNRCVVGRNLRQFKVVLPPASTALFYTGPAEMLDTL